MVQPWPRSPAELSSPGLAEISCHASTELLPVPGARIDPSWALLQRQSSPLPGMDGWIPWTLLQSSCRTFPRGLGHVSLGSCCSGHGA